MKISTMEGSPEENKIEITAKKLKSVDCQGEFDIRLQCEDQDGNVNVELFNEGIGTCIVGKLGVEVEEKIL